VLKIESQYRKALKQAFVDNFMFPIPYPMMSKSEERANYLAKFRGLKDEELQKELDLYKQRLSSPLGRFILGIQSIVYDPHLRADAANQVLTERVMHL
jgi:hypothetical protein